MTATAVNCDVIVIGGGIAGLWTLNRLCNAGYDAYLFDSGELGSGQSIASQGMIHGGIKYALGGTLTGSSEAIATMPARWKQCIAGAGDVDLRGVPVLAEAFYLWSSESLTSRLSSFFASKLTRGRVDKLDPGERPPPFDSAQFKGSVYRLVDLVLDVPGLLQKLRDNCSGRVFSIDWQQASWLRDGDRIASLRVNDALQLNTASVIFTAGAGNASLLQGLGLDAPAMQLRPLHQVMLRHDYSHPLYAHCTGASASPRLTVSSHHTRDGRWVWYLGGDLATAGVGQSPDQLIATAKHELQAVLPWVDFGRCEWATLAVDRAEPRQAQLVKPEHAFAARADGCDNLLVGWPTKLTLAPNLADRLLDLLPPPGATATAPASALMHLPVPGIAAPPWENCFS